jgi:REP element-mobilizing transposase RayT
VTFVTSEHWVLPPTARDIVLQACLYFNGTKIDLRATVVMPDHVHLIFIALRDETGECFSFAEILGSIKGFSAHSINKVLRRRGSVWLDESFDHVVRCEEKFEQKIEYVRQNPVRRGLVRTPEQYRWLWVKVAQPRTAVPHGQR